MDTMAGTAATTTNTISGISAVNFPIGSIVENIGHMAIGTSYNEPDRLGVTRRGTVIASNDPRDCGRVHVDFGEGFRGHHLNTANGCNGHCWLLLPEELRMITLPSIETIVAAVEPQPIPTIPRLRVTIARNSDRYGNPWMLTVTNGPMITKYELKGQMDKVIARQIPGRIWNSRDIQDIVDKAVSVYNIDPQVIVDAATAAVIAKQARDGHGPFTSMVNTDGDIAAAMATQPMIVAIGDQMFTLQPKGVINGSRALKIIKDRYTTIAKTAVARIFEAAKVEAAGMIANGERQLRSARETIERERAALARSVENVMVIPEWIAVNQLKIVKWGSNAAGYNLAVEIEVSTRIKSIQIPHVTYDDDDDRDRGINGHPEIIRWTRIVDIHDYHMVTAWLPFSTVDGRYGYQSMRIIDNSSNPYQLPHLGTNRCCMTLQGMPKRMTGIEEYNKIVKIVNRGNSEINLNSLLWGYSSWHPDIQEQIPVNVKKILDNGVHEDIDERWLEGTERVAVEIEASETFDVGRLRNARVARGEEIDTSLGDHLLIDDETTDETEDMVANGEEATDGTDGR